MNKDGELGLSVNDEEGSAGLSMEDIIVRVKAELSLNPNSPVAVGGDAATPYAEVVLLLDELSSCRCAKGWPFNGYMGIARSIHKSE